MTARAKKEKLSLKVVAILLFFHLDVKDNKKIEKCATKCFKMDFLTGGLVSFEVFSLNL
jgi:hypothetical protein